MNLFLDFLIRNQGILLSFGISLVAGFIVFKVKRLLLRAQSSPTFGSGGLEDEPWQESTQERTIRGLSDVYSGKVGLEKAHTETFDYKWNPPQRKSSPGTLTTPIRVSALIIVIVLAAISYIFLHDRKPIPSTALLDFPSVEKKNLGNTKLILLLHGWNGDAHETWKMFPDLFRSDTRLKDVDIISISYPTFMGRRNLNIAELADWIVRELHAHGIETTYKKIAIIAHSMGGIVAREVVILERLRGSDKPYGLLVEIASPHNGADIASIGDVLGLSKPLADELLQGSSFLSTMNTQWINSPTHPASHCFTSKHDKVVAAESAIFLCDHFYFYPQWGHAELVKPEEANDPRYSHPATQIIEFMNNAAF